MIYEVTMVLNAGIMCVLFLGLFLGLLFCNSMILWFKFLKDLPVYFSSIVYKLFL